MTNHFPGIVLSQTKSSNPLRHVQGVDGDGQQGMFVAYGDKWNSCPDMHVLTLEMFHTKIEIDRR